MRVLLETAANTSLPSQNEGYVAPSQTVSSTVTQLGQWYVNTATEKDPDDFFGNLFGGTQYASDYTSGMGYVIRLEDGSFIIVDGGYETETHAKNLYDVLVKQSEGRDIVIAAWIFTHAHSDHAGAFKSFTSLYGSKVTVECFIYNFPTDEAAEACGDTPNIDAISHAMAKYAGARTVVAHAGQVHRIRNAVVNILYTYDMMMPYKMVDYNATSVVFNVELEGSTILFLGDAGGESDSIDGEMSHMMSIYTSETLSANIVQAAHHAIDKHNKVKEFYKLIGADYVFVPVANRYIKISGDKYIDIQERAAYSVFENKTRYLAGASVTVMTLDGGVSTQTYSDVNNYVNS